MKKIDFDQLTTAHYGFTNTSEENLCKQGSVYENKCLSQCEEQIYAVTRGLNFLTKIDPYNTLGTLLCSEWKNLYKIKSNDLGYFTVGAKFSCEYTIDGVKTHQLRNNLFSKQVTSKNLNCSFTSFISNSSYSIVNNLSITLTSLIFLFTFIKNNFSYLF